MCRIKILFVSLTLLFLSCSHTQEQKRFVEDIEQLKYSLIHGYIGADFLPKELFHSVLNELEALKNSTFYNVDDFCLKLAAIVTKLPDGHLFISSKTKDCSNQSITTKVGQNDGKIYAPDKIYHLRWIKPNLPILSIQKFPDPKDSRWENFEETIKSMMKAKSIIIDLRGNSGGNSSKAIELAKILINNTVEHSKKKIYRKNTLDAWSLYRKNIELNREMLFKKGNDVSYFDEKLKYADEEREKAGMPSAPAFLIREHSAPNLKKLNYKGNIYVLVNRRCSSSCEHLLELLKFHPHTKLIGENSYGMIHFGQLGQLELTYSKIRIGLSTQYFENFHEGFYEMTGYPPDIIVPKGKGILDLVLELSLQAN